ncbi:MAG: universal stress protein [Alphaproteobacteria bacterium]
MPTTIVVPVDISQQEAGEVALARAQQYDANAYIILLYVMPGIPADAALLIPEEITQSRDEKAHQELVEFANRNKLPKTAELVVRMGHIGREILDCAEMAKADLIVMASHDPSWGDAILGSVAAFVVRHANCSVFVVRK